MKDYTNHVTMEIKLPAHIAKWLQEFSREIAKTPDQVLVYILTYYYEAWRVGYEAGLKNSTTIHEKTLPLVTGTHIDTNSIASTLNNILNDYIAKYKYKAKYKVKYKWIIKEFISWIAKKTYRLDLEELKNAIKEFIDEYSKHREVSKNTLNVYRSALNDFIEYVCLRLKQKDVESRDR